MLARTDLFQTCRYFRSCLYARDPALPDVHWVIFSRHYNII